MDTDKKEILIVFKCAKQVTHTLTLTMNEYCNTCIRTMDYRNEDGQYILRKTLEKYLYQVVHMEENVADVTSGNAIVNMRRSAELCGLYEAVQNYLRVIRKFFTGVRLVIRYPGTVYLNSKGDPTIVPAVLNDY